MKIKVLRAGLLATVQDLGRQVLRSSGIPVGGAVDSVSHRIANYLIKNEATASTIEIAGGSFLASVEAGGWLAVMGMGGRLFLNQKDIGNGRAVFAPQGSLLEIQSNPSRNFSYFAVPGGWDVPTVLGSQSTCLSAGFGGFGGRALQKGDVLCSKVIPQKTETSSKVLASSQFVPAWFFMEYEKPIRVLAGPEIEWWNLEQQEAFFATTFSVSKQRDRMGVRLTPPSPFLRLSESRTLLSTAVDSGTIQMPPDGQPIVLLADAQTTGGYPRIGQVVSADISRLAQMPSGQTVRFQKISLEEAEHLLFQQENFLQKIRWAIR